MKIKKIFFAGAFSFYLIFMVSCDRSSDKGNSHSEKTEVEKLEEEKMKKQAETDSLQKAIDSLKTQRDSLKNELMKLQ
ncbi:MAG: hypothetical protein JW995_01960 [Melioribacteraceae bacterium]|nr:hypothetical protein [Melioribacteraceae bacterium]